MSNFNNYTNFTDLASSLFSQAILPNSKTQLTISPNVDGYSMPATIIVGGEKTSSSSSKTLLITAGLHSGEYPAIKATIDLANSLNPSEVCGNIIIIHCVNTSGFYKRSIDVVPEDGSNLNKNYPGDKNGSTGQKIADFFVSDLFPHIDFLVDMHSGGKFEALTPCLFYQTLPDVTDMSFKIANFTDIPYLIPSTAKTGHYSYAGTLGIPAVLLERGYGGLANPLDILSYKHDLLNILSGLSFLDHSRNISSIQKFNIKNPYYLESSHQGLWYPAIVPNQTVKKGQLLGVIQDFFGNTLVQYFAEFDAVIFYNTTDLSIRISDPLVAYGQLQI